MKKRVYEFHRSVGFTDVATGQEVKILMQDYSIGVYVTMNGAQFGLHPKDAVKGEKNLLEAAEKGLIKDLELSWLVRLTEGECGFERIKDEN